MKRSLVTGVVILGVAITALTVWLTRPKPTRIKNIHNLKNLGLAIKDHNRDMVDPRNLTGVVADNNGNWTLPGRIPTNAIPASNNSINTRTNL